MKVDPVDPCVVGKLWGLQESGDAPLCLLPALCHPKCVFSVRLNGTLGENRRFSLWLGGSSRRL